MSHQAVSEHARLIADSAYEFAQGSGGLVRARKLRDNWPSHDAQAWQQITDLGWLGMCVPEEEGGLGLQVGDLCALQESVGKLLLPEPVVPAMAAAKLLADCGTDAARSALEAVLVDGKIYVPVKARYTGSPLMLSHVPDCHAPVTLLVCRDEGERSEIRAVELHASGVSVRTAESVDGGSLSEIAIDASAWESATLMAQGSSASAAFEKAADLMRFGYSAYLVGLMDGALQMALSYMKIREQFGTPIGSFQALQHRAVNCHVDIAATRALLYEAASVATTHKRSLAATAVKARSSAAALRVTKECVQFHGAIGFADEHDIGLYLRKAMSLAARMGGTMEHSLRFGQLAQAGH